MTEGTGILHAKEIIARHVAHEVRPGMLVNLGIGLPSLVANYLPADAGLVAGAKRVIVAMVHAAKGLRR